MKEKISWLFVMLFVMSLVACSGSSSTSTSDECTEDPNAPGCSVDDNTPAEMEQIIYLTIFTFFVKNC